MAVPKSAWYAIVAYSIQKLCYDFGCCLLTRSTLPSFKPCNAENAPQGGLPSQHRGLLLREIAGDSFCVFSSKFHPVSRSIAQPGSRPKPSLPWSLVLVTRSRFPSAADASTSHLPEDLALLKPQPSA